MKVIKKQYNYKTYCLKLSKWLIQTNVKKNIITIKDNEQ